MSRQRVEKRKTYYYNFHYETFKGGDRFEELGRQH
jgi:hypothetical protein